MWYPSVLPGRNNNETRWCLLKTNLFELCNTCVFAELKHISFISPPPSTQWRHWTVKCLSGHPGVCVWAPAPEGVFATAPVTSFCGRPMLAPPAPSWRNRLNVYHTAVWNSSNPQWGTITDAASIQHWDSHVITAGLRNVAASWALPWQCKGWFVFVTGKLWKLSSLVALSVQHIYTHLWVYSNDNDFNELPRMQNRNTYRNRCKPVSSQRLVWDILWFAHFQQQMFSKCMLIMANPFKNVHLQHAHGTEISSQRSLHILRTYRH